MNLLVGNACSASTRDKHGPWWFKPVTFRTKDEETGRSLGPAGELQAQ